MTRLGDAMAERAELQAKCQRSGMTTLADAVRLRELNEEIRALVLGSHLGRDGSSGVSEPPGDRALVIREAHGGSRTRVYFHDERRRPDRADEPPYFASVTLDQDDETWGAFLARGDVEALHDWTGGLLEDEGMDTTPEPGIPVWLCVTMVVAILVGFTVAMVVS